jgi:hypothetical protein
MSLPRRTLTKEEFQQLLQRAAERHTLETPRDFTADELVEAGKELGIDAGTIREVHQEHEQALARSDALPPARPRPFDSKLRLTTEGGTLFLAIPPATSKLKAGVLTVFMAGAFTFAAVMGAPWPFTAFLAVGGLLMSFVSLRAANTRHELRLRRDGGGQLCRFIGQRGKAVELQSGQVHARLDSRVEGDEKQGYSKVTFVALDHGTETHELCEGLSHPEQAWVVEEIERWLGRKTRF